MQLVPDPDSFVARARTAMSMQRNALLARVPVVGLAVPALTAGVLLENQTGSEGFLVRLGYGAQLDAAGRFVSVTTTVSSQPHEPMSELLADERDRLFNHAGIDEPEPVDVSSEPGVLTVDGYGLPTRIRREDGLWAAQALLPPELAPPATASEQAMVSVVSRGVVPGQIRLTLVHDLAPYWAAREDWLATEAERFAMRPEPDPLPDDGIEPHARLVRLAIANRVRLDQNSGRRPRQRHPRRPVDEWERAWESALQTQIRLGGQPPDQANLAVAMMVNQLSELAATVDWWDRDGEAATAETIRYLIFDSDVPSRAAQQLWQSRFTAIRPVDGDWLAAWQAWHDAR